MLKEINGDFLQLLRGFAAQTVHAHVIRIAGDAHVFQPHALLSRFCSIQ